ncbi:RloB family protein [Thermopolyspora sp. NPDC052614]|uniref:RloB family protein n=1 Tax=Thermopolyspora sp. NPDC052614 TaxID=3155682 RepID=UPI00344812BA
MSRRSRRSSKPLVRDQGNRQEQKRFLIYCEGRVTERIYLSTLRRELRIPGVQFGTVFGEPLGLVKAAISHKERAPRSAADKCTPYDEVWCVLDVEAPSPHPSLERALSLAAQQGVRCAISNPCFELWLILHVQNERRPLTTDEACRILERHGGCSYTRDGKSFRPEALMDNHEVARKRAQVLAEAHGEGRRPADCNPFTSVWELVDAMRATVVEP